MNKSIRIFVAILIFISALFAKGFDQAAKTAMRYGPNFSWSALGNTPFVWGQWFPQLIFQTHYTWLEPLDDLNYGTFLEMLPTFFKMEVGLEVSPFYGGYSAGLGLRPFKTNPQLEVNFNYESYLYFKSNLEMVTRDVEGSKRIAESWNADYIADNVWTNAAGDLDYVQLFDMGFSLEYLFPKGSLIGGSIHYILTDISTDFDGKSYDFKRNIPVFNRDFLLDIQFYGEYRFSKNWAGIFESTYYRTGYLRNGETVEKESLGYGLGLAGVHYSWDRGLKNLTLEFGGWSRHKQSSYDGSIAQKLLIQLEYQGYFSMPTELFLLD